MEEKQMNGINGIRKFNERQRLRTKEHFLTVAEIISDMTVLTTII